MRVIWDAVTPMWHHCDAVALLAIIVPTARNCNRRYDIVLSHIHGPPSWPSAHCERTVIRFDAVDTVNCFRRDSIGVKIGALEGWAVQKNISWKEE